MRVRPFTAVPCPLYPWNCATHGDTHTPHTCTCRTCASHVHAPQVHSTPHTCTCVHMHSASHLHHTCTSVCVHTCTRHIAHTQVGVFPQSESRCSVRRLAVVAVTCRCVALSRRKDVTGGRSSLDTRQGGVYRGGPGPTLSI